MARKLRAASPDERPEVLTVSQAAALGDRVAELRAMRKVLAEAIDAGPPPRDLAALTNRLAQVGREIEEVEAQEREARVTVNDARDAKWRPEAI